MSPREQARLLVLNALGRGELTMAEAARLVGLSVRQLRRLRRAYRTRGAAALAHGNRGRPSPRRLGDALRTRIIKLARTTYAGVNHQHFTELLREREGTTVSRQTISRLLREAGLRSPRTRRAPRHRSRRDRMPQPGMLVQLDGSHHAWLEDRGPRLVLHAIVDDATTQVLAGWFDAQETAGGYLHALHHMTREVGLPLAAYSDRHTIFARSRRQPWTLAEQLQGQQVPTQIGRVLAELGIQWIPASSPQAKGRIERLFGAFQDRLVTELRLAGIADRDAANAFMPAFLARYNARFAKPATQPKSVFRPWPKDRDPHTVFCFKYLRVVGNDNTVTVGPYALQLLPGPGGRSYAKARVEVHERLDGTLAVWYHGRQLPAQILMAPERHTNQIRARRYPRVTAGPIRPQQQRKARARGVRSPRTELYRPGPDHPWKRYIEPEKLKALKAGGGHFH